jgi:membrane-bound metal-dependent hydrolase YbcI (DUF457 family)
MSPVRRRGRRVVYLWFRSKIWALAFLLGEFAHVLADTGDSVGVMLFFPFTTTT